MAFFFLRFYLFTFRQRRREGERRGEKHQCVAASHVPPTRDPACNPGTCPNREPHLQPFGSQAGTGPHQPGLNSIIDYPNLTDISRTSHITTIEYKFLSSLRSTLTKTHSVLDLRTCLGKFKRLKAYRVCSLIIGN